MNLLAIDTSTEIASIALLVGDVMTCEEQPSLKTHAQLVLPIIDSLMVNAGLHLNQLDAIVFGCGPGSFTGLRIACSIAKGLAYAHDLSLIPVSSLAAIAYSVSMQQDYTQAPVLAILDARMHEVYWSYFPEGILKAQEKVSAVQDIQVPDDRPLVLAGVGVDAYWNDVPDR